MLEKWLDMDYWIGGDGVNMEYLFSNSNSEPVDEAKISGV